MDRKGHRTAGLPGGLLVATIAAGLAMGLMPVVPSSVVAEIPSASPTDSAAPSAGLVPSASPSPSPSALATAQPSAADSASPSPAPTDTASASPAPTSSASPGLPPATVTVKQTSSAPAAGSHRVDPGSLLSINLTVSVVGDLTGGTLSDTIPAGWTVTDAGGGTADVTSSTVRWVVGSLSSGGSTSRTLVVRAPGVPFSDGTFSANASFASSFDQAGAVTTGPVVSVMVAPVLVIDHWSFAPIPAPGAAPQYLAEDAALLDEPRYADVRVRFFVTNLDTTTATIVPQLGYESSSGTSIVPAHASATDPFRVSTEWIQIANGGTVLGPTLLAIPASSLDSDKVTFVDGIRAMGIDPAPAFSVAAGARTAIEFTVRATVAASYLSTTSFSLSDAGAPIAGAVRAPLTMAAAPPIALSPGQRLGQDGIDVLLRYALIAPSTIPQYPLQPSALSGVAMTPFLATGTNVHDSFTSGSSDACAACHAGHSSQGSSLTVSAGPQYGLCSRCHATPGSTSPADIIPDYSSAPVNDPTTRSYYSHDPTAGTEFHQNAMGEVILSPDQRHAECADCHQPHVASDASGPVQTSGGWTVSSRLMGAMAAQPTNPTDPTRTPTYSLVPATPGTPEYALCFKCHAGIAALLPDPTGSPTPYSWYELDKGVEFNPNNRSFHPVEAAGSNTSAAMASSLAGTSPYKLWDLSTNSTVRCSQCHADSSKVPQSAGDPTSGTNVPTQDASLPTHASANRGILLLPYRDRTTGSAGDTYAASTVALCLACHAEAPLIDTTGASADTAFSFHGLHVSGAARGYGSGSTSIDVPGGGQGLATCAECHFRLHSSSFAVPGQSLGGWTSGGLDQGGGPGLVNFAPDVQPVTPGGTIVWVRKTATTRGSCTLVCHGVVHDPAAGSFSPTY
ncbi:MAG TPA: cytochrome c3 family protein [Candidatus Limnocylindrales bacterium]